jgi:hypothetical protein
MKYIYTILIIGLIFILWFAPIDLERERSMADTAGRRIVLFVLETTWVKVLATIFLGLIALGLHSEGRNNSEG